MDLLHLHREGENLSDGILENQKGVVYADARGTVNIGGLGLGLVKGDFADRTLKGEKGVVYPDFCISVNIAV